jgi:hypothetical protein
VLGGCVTPEIARRVCGPSLLALAGGCAPRPPCARGEARDAKGECIVASRVRALTEGTGLMLGDDDVGCERADASMEEEELIERGGRLACVKRMPPIRPCPPGAVDDRGTCVRVKNGDLFDAALWLRAVVGPSGGAGAPAICRAVEEHAHASGGRSSAAMPGDDLEIVLVFVDNDVSQLELRTRPSDAALELELRPFADVARAFGGAARTSEAATRIRCRRPTSAGPRAIPRSN